VSAATSRFIAYLSQSRKYYYNRQRKTREIRPRKTRRKAEKFFEKGVAISYFACYNNTCVTATDMR
ncbi:hypothetical protein, partial [Hominenteromicrobium sp.]|uniref:hypothetical protein n=1 Tax=Hominenteromicrobium sp. TaxID=3073581 RepID=UPI003A8CB96D